MSDSTLPRSSSGDEPPPKPRRRRFNTTERAALFLASDGHCESCGTDLNSGWHGDHIHPYSKGGATDVTNGQALCPPCNLKKGPRVDHLREWQSQALDLFLSDNSDFLAVATPGAGKTTFALAAAQRLIERGDITRIIVVVPTAHLRKQWAHAASKMGIQLDPYFTNSIKRIANDFDGIVATYDTITSTPLLWRKLASDYPTLVVLDEAHHGGDELAWGKALRSAFEHATRRLLLSGTPFRSDRTAIPFVRYDDARRCIPSYNYDYGEALRDRTVVRPIEFPVLDGHVRWRNAGAITQTTLNDADDETLAKALKSALDPSGDWIASVLKRADAELNRQRVDVPDAAGLVVSSDQFKARAYAKILESITGEETTIAISDEPDSSDRIARFAEGSSKWIVAVQMVSEGVDIPRLAVGVYASRIKTKMFFRQVVGRFVRKRGEEDEVYSSLFIPSIQPLLGFAQDIERTVEDALADEEERARRERKESSTQTTLQFDLVEPIDSSEAVHSSTIQSGESFTDEELNRAMEHGKAVGMPSSVTAATIARLLRKAGAGRVVGTAQVTQPEAKPLADQKKATRSLLQKKVGRIARLRDVPHSHIHGKLNDICGDTSPTATAETLEKRLDLLDRWLSES